MATDLHASSTGQWYTSASYLDAHFEACRREYEAHLRMAGLEPGWHVLDAGSGTGGYLPWIADEVGDTGQVTAIDLAEDNVDEIKRHLEERKLPCLANAITASILELPFDDNSFDAVWCANTLIYVADGGSGWKTALDELQRVVRPGGLVAIKDVDTSLYRLRPSDPVMMPLFYRVGTRMADNWTGIACFDGTWNLRRELERTGLVDVWQKTTLTERWSPLSEADRAYLEQLLGSFSAVLASSSETMSIEEIADWFGVQAAEISDWLAFWESMCQFDHPDHIFNHPDFYWSEGQVLAVGRVPDERRVSK